MRVLLGYLSKIIFSFTSLCLTVLIYRFLSVLLSKRYYTWLITKNTKITHIQRLMCQRLHWTRKKSRNLLKNTGKIGNTTGKVREFCQSEKVGTLLSAMLDTRKMTSTVWLTQHSRVVYNTWVFRKFANQNKSTKTNKTKVHQTVLFGL